MVPQPIIIGILLCPGLEIGAPRLAGRRPEFGLVGRKNGSFFSGDLNSIKNNELNHPSGWLSPSSGIQMRRTVKTLVKGYFWRDFKTSNHPTCRREPFWQAQPIIPKNFVQNQTLFKI